MELLTRKRLLLLAASLMILLSGFAIEPSEVRKFTLSGTVRNSSNGELLIGATIYCPEIQSGTVTNYYGFYSLSLPQGEYSIRFSYMGFKVTEKKVLLQSNQKMDIDLEPLEEQLEEVVITGKRGDENVRAPEMSIVKLDAKTINKIPALLGETDIIKAIQLLPGVQSTSEGSTGFSVRGGSPDQNLIILDEATVYNASHLIGFFSIFNNDAVKDVALYKGDIPAAYGGRLSSLLDVRMKGGNSRKFSATGGIGTISSRLTLEGPVVNEKTSFLLSGRRTYADLFLPFAKNDDLQGNKLYFYDLNARIAHTFNENNRVYLSGYMGRDTFKNKYAQMGFGNRMASFRWNHLFSQKLFLNTTAAYTNYEYSVGTPPGEASSFLWESTMNDFSLRTDFTAYPNPSNTTRFGASSTFHNFFPGITKGQGSESLLIEFKLPRQYALEHALYASNEQKLSPLLTLKYGLRFSAFQNIGPGTYFTYDSLYNPVDSINYNDSEIFHTWLGLEPRISFVWILSEQSSVKGNYSHTIQYLTLAQNSTAGTPLDVWFPASPNVKPQNADQFAVGYFRNFSRNRYEASVETYYKKIGHVIDFKDHAALLMNEYLEGELRVGKGMAYGLEFMIRKNTGRLGGWISYTWSRSWRIIPEINDGMKYPAPYDKPHSIAVVLNYAITARIEASANWVYSTGLPVTFPTGRAVIGNAVVPVYSDRNAYRMPDYHRLDCAITFKGKDKPGKNWHQELNLSVYNAYARKNAWSINFVQDKSDPNVTFAVKTYLFSVIPAITYNFNF
ncbi:MAG TPA: TonB-dependent receptor [Bacteroidales bacterium]|nr:TonB-dependent receptor [Bacteroidales bacterium]